MLVINVCSIRLGLININFEILYLQLGDDELEERAEIGFFLKIESRARGIIQCR